MDLNFYLKTHKISKKQASTDLNIEYCYFLKICNGQVIPTTATVVQIWVYTDEQVGLLHWFHQLKELGRYKKCKRRTKPNDSDEKSVESDQQTCENTKKNYQSVCY